jgi:hypothetical protein
VFATLGVFGVEAVSNGEDATALPRVPIAALIVTPERYDGAQIEVTAWGVLEFELAALFLTELDYQHLGPENAIRLEITEGQGFPTSAKGYLSVVGRFRAGDRARGFAGRMTEIRTLTKQQFRHSPH